MPRRGPRSGDRASAQSGRHIPVLLTSVLQALAPKDGETYIDATFGAGGYARAMLEAADCKVIAFDRDPTAIAAAQSMRDEFGERLQLIQRPFGDLLEMTRDMAASSATPAGSVDAVIFDLGVSSMQLDQPERGFSFQADGPLDMRMEGEASELSSAADVVNTYDETDLANIIYHLGEERRSRAIASAIVTRRAQKPFTRTLELADLTAKVIGRGPPGKNPATRTFQALRMYVNDELGQLVKGLAGAERALRPGGRLIAVTFHSLEDRIVKRFIASRSGKTEGVSRHVPAPIDSILPASFQIINLRSLTSSKAELEGNPRARSARLRFAIRTEADPWPVEAADLGMPKLDVKN